MSGSFHGTLNPWLGHLWALRASSLSDATRRPASLCEFSASDLESAISQKSPDRLSTHVETKSGHRLLLAVGLVLSSRP